MPQPRILSVGQCALDHGTLTRHLGRQFGADVTGAATAAEALAALRAARFDLVLVNRVGDRDGASGLDLIRTLRADPDLATVPVMLVSNYPDAQAEAESLGASPGFGKAELATPRALERIGAILGSDVPAGRDPAGDR